MVGAGKRRKLEATLIDPEKDKLGMRPGLAPLTLEKIFEPLLLLPDPGNEGDVREKMPGQHNAAAQRANCRHHEVTMSGEPMHDAILGLETNCCHD